MPELKLWRVGRKIPLNVYEGDRPVCQCHTETDAQHIVDAMNARYDRDRLKVHAEAMAEELKDAERILHDMFMAAEHGGRLDEADRCLGICDSHQRVLAAYRNDFPEES